MYDFCTYFDHNYLPKGLALYHSLVRCCLNFHLFVLCLSKECYNTLSELNLDNVQLIQLDEFEKGDEDLLRAKQNRTLIEYYFTITPSLPLYIFKHYPAVDIITYLDSDLYFFEEPKPIFEEIGNKSIAIIAHRFPPKLRELENRGKFNVGWMTFRRDKNGLSCLDWYRTKCIEWCHDRVEKGRYADQKYLNYFQDQFEGVIVIQYKGANLAPWNIDNYNLRIKNNSICVDNEKLCFFHFQGLEHIMGPLYDTGFCNYGAKLNEIIRKHIYTPYLYSIISLNQGRKSKINGIRMSELRVAFFENLFPKVFKILRCIKRMGKILITKTFIVYYKHRTD